jgi:DeoR family transcriptional regulator of aga operon
LSPKHSQRTDEILKLVRQGGMIANEQLAEHLSVSVTTVRRDLQDLEMQGLLRRTHGGAIAIEPLFYEPFRHDSSFQEQTGRNAEEKRRIGFAAAAMVEDGDTIAVTPGTTTTEVVRNLRNLRGVTVVTSTVNVAMELSNRKDIEVYLTGGYLRGHWFSMVGPAAVHSARRIFPDKMFVGVNGMDADRGLTSLDEEEAELISVMMEQSKRKIVVADHTKLGAVATHLIAPVDGVERLITDTAAADLQLAPFGARKIEVVRV